MYINCSGFPANESCYLYVSETGGEGTSVYPANMTCRIKADESGRMIFRMPLPMDPYHAGRSYSAEWFCDSSSHDSLAFVVGIPGQPAQVTDWMEWLKNEGNLAYLGLIGCAGVVGLIIIGVGLGILAKARAA